MAQPNSPTSAPTDPGTVRDIAALVEQYHEPRTIAVKRGDDAEAQILVIPKGMEAKQVDEILDRYRERPRFREGVATLASLPSFVELLNRFASLDDVTSDEVAVFADPGDDEKGRAPSLVAVLDYHQPGPDGLAGRRKHRLQHALPHSPEWEAWTGLGEWVPQAEFAQFLSERLLDLAGPTAATQTAREFAVRTGLAFAAPAEILALSRGLELRVESTVANVTNLANGTVKLAYQDSHSNAAGEPLVVPQAFLLGIPVYLFGEPVEVPVRLRYRAKPGTAQVFWSATLFASEKAERAAFEGITTHVRLACKVPVYDGTPE